MSIGAISDHGLSTYYTESCASTLAVTYSGGSHREKSENKIVSGFLVDVTRKEPRLNQAEFVRIAFEQGKLIF